MFKYMQSHKNKNSPEIKTSQLLFGQNLKKHSFSHTLQKQKSDGWLENLIKKFDFFFGLKFGFSKCK